MVKKNGETVRQCQCNGEEDGRRVCAKLVRRRLYTEAAEGWQGDRTQEKGLREGASAVQV